VSIKLVSWLLASALVLGVSGCAGDDESSVNPESLPHTHGSLPVGEGLRSDYVGYAIEDLVLPAEPGVPGRLSFRIGTYRGTPQTDFLVDLTKRMHVYLIREDLAEFRHLHPTMSADGTWSQSVTVPTAGRYRLIAEFVAKDDGGNGDHLVLGEARTVGSKVAAVPLGPVTGTGTVNGLTVRLDSRLRTGNTETMSLALSFDGAPAGLGTFLGVYGHVTGVAAESGAIVHMHPLGPPATEGDEAVLSFHTDFKRPGVYRLFVQVRLSGIVRTVPVNVRVSGPTTEA
jgi:hypothetical protein